MENQVTAATHRIANPKKPEGKRLAAPEWKGESTVERMIPELCRNLSKISRMDALAFIDKPLDAKKLAPIYVLHGEEDFLKRQVLSVLRKVVFGSEENEFGFSTQPGDKAE